MANTQYQNVWDDTKQAALDRAVELEEYRQRLLARTNVESGEWTEVTAEEMQMLIDGGDARDDILYLVVG